jgi:branched-subunit amino acid aminotransferase/4-amino-4-deoxychorismate lyase
LIVHLNGLFLPAAEARISIWDGGFMYGDGVYTTLRLYGGVPLDLAAHLGRLERHARALALPCPVTEAGLRGIIAELVRQNRREREDSRLRITISRGGTWERPMPLEGLAELEPTVLLTLAPLPRDLDRRQAEGIAATILEPEFARGNFPELKTLNGLPTLLALRRAAARGCQEALLTGPGGRLLEGAISNLFLVRGGRLHTPAAGEGFLAGRTRERILALARSQAIPLGEQELDLDDLAAADEVFLAGSVREIQPVVRVDERPVGGGRPGPVTRRLQTAYRELVARELASS